MRKKLLLIVILTAGLAITLVAQDHPAPASTPVVLPPGPLIKPFPNLVRWTITRKGAESVGQEPDAAPGSSPGQKGSGETKDDEKRNSRFDVQIVGEKVGDISHIVTTFSNGNKQEVWKKAGVQTTLSTGWKQPIAGPAGEESEDISWISGSNYMGINKISGRDCMIFRDRILPEGYRSRPDLFQISTPKDAKGQVDEDAVEKVLGVKRSALDPEKLKVIAVAEIDLEARLPIALQLGKVVTTYKYETLAPTYTLTLPTEIQAVLEARNQQLQAATRKPVRP